MRDYKIPKSYVIRHALPITLAVSLALIFGGSIQAQQTSEPEFTVNVSYDRFENVTQYESNLKFEAQDKKQYGSATVDMSAAFACRGNTGNQPCIPQLVSLRFSYVVWEKGSLGKSIEEYENAFNDRPLPKPPFNYTYRSVIALADGNNMPLGNMAVRHHYNHEMKATSWDGVLKVDLPTLRRLATAGSVEMRIGVLPVTLTDEHKKALAGFYNMAVLSAPKTTPKTRNTRRPKLKQ